MSKPFELTDDDGDPRQSEQSKPFSPEAEERLRLMMSRMLKSEEPERLESLLLARLKQYKAELADM